MHRSDPSASLHFRPTPDGSVTLYSPQFQQHYHSVFGAKQESERVFIELGLEEAFHKFQIVKVLEMGFGTGLNAWLTAKYANIRQRKVTYIGLEAFPISAVTAAELHQLTPFFDDDFLALHDRSWDELHEVSAYFRFKKYALSLADYRPKATFNLIYYDAFAPETQPELWSQAVFEQLALWLEPQGILTTYCSKTMVQRHLRAAGFAVEKHQGPPHKREVLRAVRR